MADSKISALPAASAGVTTQEIPINDSATTKKLTVDQIIVLTKSVTGVSGISTASQSPTANTDTYLTGSRLLVPASTGRGSLKVGSIYQVRIQASKTAAGLVAPVFTVRFGTAGTTADTAICSATGAAQTAVADLGVWTITVPFLTVGTGTTATARALLQLTHNTQALTGLGGLPTTAPAVGSGFNSQTASAGIGVSLNTGTSGAWTITSVVAELSYLT